MNRITRTLAALVLTLAGLSATAPPAAADFGTWTCGPTIVHTQPDGRTRVFQSCQDGPGNQYRVSGRWCLNGDGGTRGGEQPLCTTTWSPWVDYCTDGTGGCPLPSARSPYVGWLYSGTGKQSRTV